MTNVFRVGDEEYRFEIMGPLCTTHPLQFLDEESARLEDRFHRTVKIRRLRDSRLWTGASDIESWDMNDLPTYLQRWLENCFALWDPNAIPEGFEIPQGKIPRKPVKHHCPEFPIPVIPTQISADFDAFVRTYANDSTIVDMASEESFPASDPPQWTSLRVG